MKKLLTWPELLKLAREHYNDGGDGIVECWTESDFDEYVSEFGPMTKADALQMFGDRDEVIRDMEADANSYREEATQDTTRDTTTDAEWDDDWQEWDDDWQEWDDDWRPGDAPWNAPGMSPADFI